MTPQHAQSSGGGSAGRAIVLVIVAVALGAFLLARGFDDSDDGTEDSSSPMTDESTNGDPEEAETNGTTSTTTTTTTTTTAPPVITHPPGEVKVAVMNGTGARGRAGRTADTLNATGFVTAAKNTQQDRVEASVIYYRPGYGDDAKAVASVLGAPPDIITPAPGTIMTLIRNPESPADLEEFNIFAVVGTDNVILDPDPPADSG
ncbi:MAG: LytR family transcriptional regulator [Acidimicrobiaceae bacterium]|nr:LytR family transcriptional regulator [Acidimicrobiaceae bacterium]MYE09219.1 LytR family transcriptional regulator [Acidimicrobiaceae bacterium]